MSGALGRRAFSCGPPLLLFGVMPLVVKLPALCWLAALRGVGLEIWLFRVEGTFVGFTQICLHLAYKLWLRQSFHANLVAPRVLPGGRRLCGRQRLYANPLYLVFCREEGTFVAQAKVSHNSGCTSVLPHA